MSMSKDPYIYKVVGVTETLGETMVLYEVAFQSGHEAYKMLTKAKAEVPQCVWEVQFIPLDVDGYADATLNYLKSYYADINADLFSEV